MQGADRSQQIASLLIGTAADRMGPPLNKEGVRAIQQSIDECIRLGRPIGIHVMWGGLKHYVDLDKQDIDAAELFALIQFYRLHRGIKSIYAPGASICFYLEDFGVAYEDAGGRDSATHKRVWAAVERYCTRFEQLVAAAGQPFALCKRFVEVCPRQKWSLMISRANDNLSVLRDAWKLCERGDEASLNGARRVLELIGWQGDLPEILRTHYLRRLQSLYAGEEVEERVDRLLRYFAMVALYQQTGVYQPATASTKFAMYLPSPGTPRVRLHGRLHMRTVSSSYCTQTMPPWTSLGCFEISQSGMPLMKIRSRKIVKQGSIAMRPIEIVVEGIRGTTTVHSQILQG